MQMITAQPTTTAAADTVLTLHPAQGQVLLDLDPPQVDDDKYDIVLLD